MKKYDLLAFIAVILIIIARVAPLVSNWGLSFFWPSEAGTFSCLQRLSVLATMPIMMALDIAIGIWLLLEARKDGRAPWVWFLFGFSFQLVGVAVFYLLRIHEILKKKDQGEPAA